MKRVYYALIYIITIVIAIAYGITWYLKDNLGVTLKVILYTLSGPLEGANTSFLSGTVKYIVVIMIGLTMCFLCIYMIESFFSRISICITGKIENKSIRVDFLHVFRFVLTILVLSFGIYTFRYADETLEISEYISSLNHQTHIYEEQYIRPSSVTVNAPKHKRNLLLIYLESLETTYASEQVGGRQTINNYIPNLTKLANDNTSFSNTDKLGGFHSVTGTNWTFAAMFATSSGLPFSFPVEGNSVYKDQHVIADGTETIGDILAEDGYTQEFLCGSDGDFAGRKSFYERHGKYYTFDYYEAIRKGYIPDDYYVWWGLEDAKLYEIAKDELLRLSSGENPFNLTMLTVDTHYWGGYICELCRDEYPDRTANVVSCADRQIQNFIDWCKCQDFYANTTIVIIGDHPCMDNYLCEGVPYKDRTVYNCIINPDPVENKQRYQERDFTAMDMFPTVLSAMGYAIEGDRLGIGTDLFSSTPTLIEDMGYDEFEYEIDSFSQYYVDTFR